MKKLYSLNFIPGLMNRYSDIKAIILAAGSGERIGKPKAFLKFRQHTFIEEIYKQLHIAQLTKIAVVTTISQYPLLKQLSLPITEYILNFVPQFGQFSSIRLVLITAEKTLKGVLLIPVDHPAVRAETFSVLIHHWLANAKKNIIVPLYNSQPGHPVIIPSTFFPHLIAAPQKYTLRIFLEEVKDRIQLVKVTDPGITLNINTWQDYQHLCELYENEK